MVCVHGKDEKLEIIRSLHSGGSLVYSWTLTKLDLIKAEHQSEGEAACCQEVFKLWLKGPDATWGNLIELLIDCEQTALAEQVKDRFVEYVNYC